MELFDAERIRSLLGEFVHRLGETGESYDGVVIGGAALALDAIPARSATQDIDTFGHLSEAASAIIADIATRENLPPWWLNRQAQAFMSPFATTIHLPVLFEHRNARVRLMDHRTLLALKLRAGRPSKDADDIRALLQLLKIRSLGEAQQIVEEYWNGEHQMAHAAHEIVTRHLSSRGAASEGSAS